MVTSSRLITWFKTKMASTTWLKMVVLIVLMIPWNVARMTIWENVIVGAVTMLIVLHYSGKWERELLVKP